MTGEYWNRITAQRITRRRMLQASGVAGVAAGAVWVAGCSSSSTKSSTPGASPTSGVTGSDSKTPGSLNAQNPPRSGGRYGVGVPASFDTFDPHLSAVAGLPFMPRIYNVLANQSATKPEYQFFDLAQSMENPDEVTWVFKIRPGVRIGPNDLGVPERDLDPQDVVATFERIKAAPKALNGAFAKEFVESVSASGDTVTIKTTKPYAWFLSRAGNFANTIPPRELIADDASVSKTHDKSAGAGPFRLVKSTEGDGATFDRNPSYYLKDESQGNAALPYIDGIDARIITDRAAWRAAFQSGQVHQYSADSKGEADQLAGDANVFVQKAPAFLFVPLTMNVEKPPFNDPRARRAISRAINRQQIIDVVYRGDAHANGLVHWPCGIGTYAFTDDELQQYQPHDPQDARQLVDALGGLKMTLTYPTGAPVAQHDRHVPVILEQLKAAGIDVTEEALPLPTWLEHYRERAYTISLALTQMIETPELPLNWHQAAGPAGDRSFGVGLGDPEIEAALLKAKTVLDFQGRVQAVREAQKVIYARDPMFLPLVCGYTYTAYSKRVHNVVDGLGTTGSLLNTFWLEG